MLSACCSCKNFIGVNINMEKIKSRLLNILIPCAITLFVACAAYALFITPSKFTEILFILFLIIQLVLGLLICILSLKITQRATHLFIGLLIFFWGILQLISEFYFTVGLEVLWPVYSVTAGITLFISGFYKYKKIKFGYSIPAVTIFFMGIWFSLFTFNIIKKSFFDLVAVLGPVFMGLVAISLILLYFLQKKHNKFIILDDETGTFTDEEDAFMDMENENDEK